MGEVWRARHTSLGTPCAVKLVAVSGDAETVRRLLMEARAAASIVSPNVVRIFDHGHDAGLAYIAMELLVGETLAERLKRERKLSAHATVLVARGIAQGITVAHAAGVVHRDLKPENVFLAKTEHGEVAKVLDFGIAKSLSQPGMTQSNVVIGTPAYLSREQVMGTHAVDHQADLWALAILTYECLTGRLPYAAATMAELFGQIVGGSAREMAARTSDLPHGFGAWFMRATHPDPTQRFTDARDLVETLARVLAPDLSIVPWEVQSIARAPLTAKKRTGLYIAAAMSLLAVGLTVLAVREGMRMRAEAAPASAEARVAEGPPASATTSSSPAPTASAAASAAEAPATSATAGSATSSAAPSASASVRRPTGKYNRWGL